MRLFETRERALEMPTTWRLGMTPRLFEARAKTELELARGLVGERDGRDARDVLACRESLDDALHEHRGLARAGRGLDEKRRVEGRGDPLARRTVGDHGILRSALSDAITSSSTRPALATNFFKRRSSPSPQTAR